MIGVNNSQVSDNVRAAAGATDDDYISQQVVQHVLSGASCCVTGPPGTGKSWLLGLVRDKLEAAGERVEVLAPTNAAARVVKGCTIHAFLTRVASSRYGFEGTLLIDEVSMLSLALVAVLDQHWPEKGEPDDEARVELCQALHAQFGASFDPQQPPFLVDGQPALVQHHQCDRYRGITAPLFPRRQRIYRALRDE